MLTEAHARSIQHKTDPSGAGAIQVYRCAGDAGLLKPYTLVIHNLALAKPANAFRPLVISFYVVSHLHLSSITQPLKLLEVLATSLWKTVVSHLGGIKL